MNSSMTMKTPSKNNVKKVAPIESNSNKAEAQDIHYSITNGVEDNTETSVKVEKNTMLNETSANTQNVNEIESPEKESAAPCQFDTIPEKSTSPVGSIEQRLAAMISPTKIVADLHFERNGEYKWFFMY